MDRIHEGTAEATSGSCSGRMRAARKEEVEETATSSKHNGTVAHRPGIQGPQQAQHAAPQISSNSRGTACVQQVQQERRLCFAGDVKRQKAVGTRCRQKKLETQPPARGDIRLLQIHKEDLPHQLHSKMFQAASRHQQSNPQLRRACMQPHSHMHCFGQARSPQGPQTTPGSPHTQQISCQPAPQTTNGSSSNRRPVIIFTTKAVKRQQLHECPAGWLASSGACTPPPH